MDEVKHIADHHDVDKNMTTITTTIKQQHELSYPSSVPEVEHADAAVCADTREHVGAARKGNVVHLLVVRNELREGLAALRRERE